MLRNALWVAAQDVQSPRAAPAQGVTEEEGVKLLVQYRDAVSAYNQAMRSGDARERDAQQTIAALAYGALREWIELASRTARPAPEDT